MYRCNLCGDLSEPGQALRTHVVERPSPKHPGSEIACEIAICAHCNEELTRGVPLQVLRMQFAPSNGHAAPPAAVGRPD
jgi:hypothetical protein